ncbi:hypothetical protein P4525_01220 [Peribacillus psychrosaccharolyticus]|nr:hypothetical protein [Peribacillus psychrosaccharolyticus]
MNKIEGNVSNLGNTDLEVPRPLKYIGYFIVGFFLITILLLPILSFIL